MIGNILDPLTKEDYTRDPRNVARKAVNFMKQSGVADTAYFGPELEFFVFDDVRYDQTQYSGYYYLDSVEGAWNTGREEKPNLGYKLRYKEGYFPVPPSDALHDLRSEMMLTMIACGLKIEAQHHEVATGGQGEIDMKYAPLVQMADNVLKYKYIIKNVARKYGKTATFMPKPLFMDNGTGMHVHTSLWKDGIKNKTKPGEPLDKDIYDLEPEELAKVPKAPGSLDEALNNLERDHEFLLQGDVFTRDVINTWIWYKREKEVDAIRLRPHPYEFALYYDI